MSHLRPYSAMAINSNQPKMQNKKNSITINYNLRPVSNNPVFIDQMEMIDSESNINYTQNNDLHNNFKNT